jgi:hypothetical protein
LKSAGDSGVQIISFDLRVFCIKTAGLALAAVILLN